MEYAKQKNSILATGALAAALSGQPAHANGQENIQPIQDNTRALTGQIITFGEMNGPTVSIGGVNHGRENGVSAQIMVPTDSVTYGIAGDKSKTQAHIIAGAGKSFDNGYVYGTGSYAREEHYGKNLEAYGASIGGAYMRDGVMLDGNVIVHKGKDAHLGTDIKETTASSVNISGNVQTTTTTHTRTTTRHDFDGRTRGYANLGATFDTGKNGETRIGVQHEFGMNNDTSANIQYNHFYNNDRSKTYISADTNKRVEVGVQHAISEGNSPWSVNAMAFSEENNGKRNNGGMIGVTYRFGGGSAPSLRTRDTQNANARMNAELRNTINTSSPHAVKNVDTLGQRVTNIKTETSSSEQQEILDTITAFTTPKVVVEGDTIRVTHHGILDSDGLENIQYTLTTATGTTIVSKNGVFSGLIDGDYTITTTAEAKNGNTGEYTPAINPNEAKATIKTAPVRTPEIIKAEVENFMNGVEKYFYA